MTAAFDAQLVAGSPIPVWMAELTTAHRCTLEQAVAPCGMASGLGGPGDPGDGARCFRSYGTCPPIARSTFSPGSYTWRWVLTDVPLPPEIAAAYPNARSMLKSVSIGAQQVNLGSSSTGAGRTTITLSDSGGDSDAGPFDLDMTVRNTGRLGFTLKRWMAQWPNFGRMTLTLKLGFLASGFTTSDWATQSVGTLSGIEVDTKGEWTLRAEDELTKLKKKLPRQYSTTVELSALATPSATTWNVTDAGEIQVGDQILVTTLSGDEEVVEVTAVDTGTPSIDVTRGVNGTTAGHVLSGTVLEHVLDFKDARPVDIVQTVLEECGVTLINAASFSAADLEIGPVALTRRIPSSSSTGGDDQEQGTKLVSEVLSLFQAALHVNDDGEVCIAMNRPKRASETLETITDERIIVNSAQEQGGEPQRLTHVAVKWDEVADNQFTLTAAVNGETFVDDYFGSDDEDRKEKKIESKWLRPGSSVAYLSAVRWGHIYAFPPRGLEWSGSLRDFAISVGDIVEMDTAEVQDAYGANLAKRMVVYERRPSKDLRRIDFAAEATGFDETTDTGERWGAIAPDATNSYGSATDEEKGKYLFVGDADNLVNSGADTGYVYS